MTMSIDRVHATLLFTCGYPHVHRTARLDNKLGQFIVIKVTNIFRLIYLSWSPSVILILSPFCSTLSLYAMTIEVWKTFLLKQERKKESEKNWSRWTFACRTWTLTVDTSDKDNVYINNIDTINVLVILTLFRWFFSKMLIVIDDFVDFGHSTSFIYNFNASL